MKTIFTSLILISVHFLCYGQISKPIKWSYSSKKISTSEVVLFIKADIANGWHIYSTNQKAGGPEKTAITFQLSRDFLLIGKIIEPKPIKKFEEAFGIDVMYFEKSVVFQQKIKLIKPTTIIKAKASYMACTDEQCLPPDEVVIPIELK